MRSPQLGQKIVSFKWLPLASLAANGYHLTPMDARAWMVRLALGVGLALAVRGACGCPDPTPTPTATPTGAPKILLAFDASGSMLTDDGNGTRKIDAAKDAAVALLDTLPDSTEIGLRVYGGTLPSRPIGPACRDSKLVLPMGRVDRNRAQAEQQIRSFRGRGRTPIAYALEQAANDLGTAAQPHDRARLRRQGHLPAALAVQRRATGGQGRRRDADPGDRLQRRPRGARGARVHRQRGRRRLPRRDRRRRACARSCGRSRPARCASTSRKGKPIKGGPSARQATLITPGQYTDQMLPDSERWYADRAQARRDAEGEPVVHPARPQRRDQRRRRSSLDIVTPDFDIPAEQNSSAGNDTLFARRGFVAGRRRGLAADRRRRAGRRRRAVLQARALLPQARARGQHGQGALQRDRRAAVHVRDVGRGPRPRSRARRSSRQTTKTEAVGHARRAAQRAAAGRRRRRAGRRSASRAARCCSGGGAHEGRSRSPRGAAARAPAAAHAQQATPVVGGGSFNTALKLLRPAATPTRSRPARPCTGRSTCARARSCACAPRSTPRRSRPTSPPTTTSRAWTTSTTTWTSGARCASRSATSTTGGPRPSMLEGDDVGGREDRRGGRRRGRSASSRSWARTSTSPSSRRPASGTSRSVPPTPQSSPAEIPAELPIELEVSVEGTAEASSPDFAAKLPGPTPGADRHRRRPSEALLAGNADAGPTRR